MTSLIFTSLILGNLAIMPAEAPKQDLDEIVHQLAYCESRNREKIVNEKDYGSASIGYLQFKIKTFVHFGKRYNLPHGDPFNKEEQIAIAKEMIKEGRTNHWSVCWKKMNLSYN